MAAPELWGSFPTELQLVPSLHSFQRMQKARLFAPRLPLQLEAHVLRTPLLLRLGVVLKRS